MANNSGYIYVLANSAMPDLVKVGKTTRTPSERATELSRVTGVPTPFLVVYEQMVNDCSAAEEFVHLMLQKKGYREAENREFFRAPISEVIGIIIKMPSQFLNNSSVENDTDSEFFSNEPNDELDEFILKVSEEEDSAYPWIELWEMAENYYYGLDYYIQELAEARELYKQALKLNCLAAYDRIGNMYRYGEGVIESDKKALEWFKEGVKKGNYYCYRSMGSLFACNEQIDNFHKCYKLFFKNRHTQYCESLEKINFGIQYHCSTYITLCFSLNITPDADVTKEIKEYKIDIITSLTNDIKKYGASPDISLQNAAQRYQIARKWVEDNL